MKVKGIRNLATIQTVRNRTRPSSRAEMAAHLARWEHERVRVERELQIFEEKRANSLEALQQVRAQIDQLKQVLYDSEENQGEVTRILAGQGEQNDKNRKKIAKKVRTVTLGY